MSKTQNNTNSQQPLLHLHSQSELVRSAIQAQDFSQNSSAADNQTQNLIQGQSFTSLNESINRILKKFLSDYTFRNDRSTVELCDRVAEVMIHFLDAKVSSNTIAVEEFARILDCDDPYAKRQYFMDEYAEQQSTPQTVREKMKDKPMKEVSYKHRQSRLSEYPQQRKTLDFQLKVTSKSTISPMNLDELYSEKQCEIYENYQFLLFYLANLLCSILPLFKEVTRFQIAQSGLYSDLEDPFNDGLKKDPLYRNMCLGIFKEVQSVVIKKISQKFRIEAEEKFMETFKNSELNEHLEQQESCLAIKRALNQLREDIQLMADQKQNSMNDQNKEIIDISNKLSSGLNILNSQVDLIQNQSITQNLIKPNEEDHLRDQQIDSQISNFPYPSDNSYISVDQIINDNTHINNQAHENQSRFQDYDLKKRVLLDLLKQRRDQLKAEIQSIVESE